MKRKPQARANRVVVQGTGALRMKILYKTDHGAFHNNKPAIMVKGWCFCPLTHQKTEIIKHIDRFSAEMVLETTKRKIENLLLGRPENYRMD